MKHGAITFAFLLVAGAAGSLAFAGCGGEDEPPATTPAADTGVETTAPDTNPADTNKPETAPYTCQAPLGDFACQAPENRPGKTVCTDAMIDEFLNCFGTDGDEAKCSAARSKYPQCNTCALTDWLKVDEITGGGSLDIGACIQKIDPTGTCGKVVNCSADCVSTICAECDTEPGSGKSGTASSTEQGDCEKDVQWKGSATRPKGVCYDVAVKDYAACAGDERFAHCFVRTLDDLKFFLRGACRDGGNWSAVETDKPTDAGVSDTGTETGSDTGSDTGATDTGTDTGAEDTGSDTGAEDTGSDAVAD